MSCSHTAYASQGSNSAAAAGWRTAPDLAALGRQLCRLQARWTGLGGHHREQAGFDGGTTTWGRDKIMAYLLRMAPSPSSAELVHQTACLRPLSRDALPIVGKVPGWPNLFLGTGAGRKGILWSTGMSPGLADMILNGTSEVPGMTFLDPGRFQQG